jgi:hypothetical protein
MKRRAFILGLGAMGAGWPLRARAQANVRTIALWWSPAQVNDELPRYKRRLAELGWAEDRNLRFQVRSWEGDVPWSLPMSYLNHLLEQIGRTRRFADPVTNDADRQRFKDVAAEYQRQLDEIEENPASPPQRSLDVRRSSSTVSATPPASHHPAMPAIPV